MENYVILDVLLLFPEVKLINSLSKYFVSFILIYQGNKSHLEIRLRKVDKVNRNLFETNEYKNIYKFLMKRILDNFARFSQTIDSAYPENEPKNLFTQPLGGCSTHDFLYLFQWSSKERSAIVLDTELGMPTTSRI